MIFSANRIIFTGLELRAFLAYSRGSEPRFSGVCVDVDGCAAWSGDGIKSLTCIAMTGAPTIRRLPALRVALDSAKAASHFDAASFSLHVADRRRLLWRGFVGDEAKALQVRPDAAKSVASGIAECEDVPPFLYEDERDLASSCTIDPRALQPISIMRSLGVREVRVYMHGIGNPLSAIGEVDGCKWIAECSAPKAAKRVKR